MSKALYLPGADRTSQWFGGNWDGLVVPDLDKILLHSTETTGWPGYNGTGSNAPTATLNPWTRKIRQHFILPESARALMNPDSTPVSENKDRLCQFEIIGYSDSAVARRIGRTDRDLDNLTDADLKWLAGIIVFVMKEWTVPNKWATPFPWPRYPASWGNTSSRMSSAEYDVFSGVLGHLHASGNTHGDPKINVVKLKQFCTELLAAAAPVVKPPQPAVAYLAYPGHQHANSLRDDWHVGRIQRRLKALGLYKGAIDNSFGPGTEAAVKTFQGRNGLSRDGYVGKNTWSKLKIPK